MVAPRMARRAERERAMLFLGAAGVTIATAALIVALVRSEFRAPRAALRFDTAKDKAAAFGCPASLLGLAAILAVFIGLALGW